MPTSDPRVSDLVRAKRLRAALFLPQYRKDAVTGELRGVWVEVVRALAAHIGVALEVAELPTPARMFECLAAGDCDVASLGFDPSRVDQVEGFTPPFMRVDYTYLVPAASAIQSIAEADQPGVRIAAVRDHASTLALARIVRHATLVDAETPDAAFELLRSGQTEAWASIGPTLLHYSTRLPGAHAIAGSYGANFPALVVPKGHAARLAYVSEFVEHAKASGLIQQAIDRAGQPGYQVASGGNTS
jgi:polar amino acid transport system substrate-binding protein